MTRGIEMLHNGKTITENEDGSFSVPSQTSTDKFYEIMLLVVKDSFATVLIFSIERLKHASISMQSSYT